ncbi:MAG: S41 family peptidase [Phycisphaerae bacterium]|nr:S41 family peptidase [Phycisphaerae bacterium]
MPKQNIIWIAILLVLGVVLLGVWQLDDKHVGNGGGKTHGLQKTYEIINNEYYKTLDAAELQRAAVRGMVNSLDGFTTYFHPESADAMNQRIRGMVRSLGLELRFESGNTVGRDGVLVIGSLQDSPAHKAGICPGMRILGVDGESVKGLTEQQVRNLLAGPVGKSVKLNVADCAGAKSTITLNRKPFEIETVEGLYRDTEGRWVYRVPGEFAPLYIRITEFTPQTKQVLQTVLRKIAAESGGGLIIDLRNNPGGLLADGVAVADMFLTDGRIVTVVSRNGEEVHNAHAGTPYAKMPVVVLVNGASASSAEIVAGAMLHNGRAALVGTNTRGKGCVQTMISLPDSLGQVNLTTAEFFVDSDRPIQRKPGAKTWGVAPDIRVAMTPAQKQKLADLQIQGKVVPQVLPAAKKAKYRPPAPDVLGKKMLKADPQLQQAVELLRNPKLFHYHAHRNSDPS